VADPPLRGQLQI